MRRAIFILEGLDESIRYTWVKFQDATTRDNELHQIALVGSYLSVRRMERISHYLTEKISLLTLVPHYTSYYYHR